VIHAAQRILFFVVGRCLRVAETLADETREALSLFLFLSLGNTGNAPLLASPAIRSERRRNNGTKETPIAIPASSRLMLAPCFPRAPRPPVAHLNTGSGCLGGVDTLAPSPLRAARGNTRMKAGLRAIPAPRPAEMRVNKSSARAALIAIRFLERMHFVVENPLADFSIPSR